MSFPSKKVGEPRGWTQFTCFTQIREEADDAYTIYGYANSVIEALGSLVSWDSFLEGDFQTDFDPSTNIGDASWLGWVGYGGFMGYAQSEYAIIIYDTGTNKWYFITNYDGNNVSPESTEITSWMDFDNHTIKITREAASAEYPNGRFILYIDGTQRAEHHTTIPVSTNKLVVGAHLWLDIVVGIDYGEIALTNIQTPS